MKEIDLHNTWRMENADLEHWETLDNQSIEEFLKPKIKKSNLTYYFNFILYIIFLLAGIVLHVLNIPGYITNSKMTMLIYGLLFIDFSALCYGIYLILHFHKMNKPGESIMVILQKQLKFISTYYEVWIIIIPFAILNLSFSFTILMENQEGNFLIPNKMTFIGTHILIYLVLYGLNKLANYFQKRPVAAFLNELKNDLGVE